MLAVWGRPLRIGFTWLGPVSTYMSSCNGDCRTFSAYVQPSMPPVLQADGRSSDVSSNQARWFKIDASGYSGGQWAAAKLIAGACTSAVRSNLVAKPCLTSYSILKMAHLGSQQYRQIWLQENMCVLNSFSTKQWAVLIIESS